MIRTEILLSEKAWEYALILKVTVKHIRAELFFFIMEGEFIRHKGEIVSCVKAPMYNRLKETMK